MKTMGQNSNCIFSFWKEQTVNQTLYLFSFVIKTQILIALTLVKQTNKQIP